MATIEDIMTDALGSTIKEWFEPTFDHPFLHIDILSVPDYSKPIPKRWVEDIQIDDGGFLGFDGDDVDAMQSSGAPNSRWTSEEGKQRLKEAFARLDLPEDTANHAHLDRMDRHELSAEKRRVKQELKRYDGDFRRQFHRLPTHSEKESMRPLYVYYRRLKTLITQAEQRSGRGGSRESLATIPDGDEAPRTGAGKLEQQVSALEMRIENLQSEKSAVRTKLQSFQERFVSENNRKIRFHKDILPIEREYRMYKNLKEEIMKAETQLRELRAQS
jgi:chromosome segregation ATPase